MAIIAEVPKSFIVAHVEACKAKQVAGLPTSGKPLPVILTAPVVEQEEPVKALKKGAAPKKEAEAE